MVRWLILFLFLNIITFADGFDKRYQSIKDTKKLKQEFVKIMLPMIEKANANVAAEREWLVDFFDKMDSGFYNVSAKDLEKLAEISKKYKVKNMFDRVELLKRVDVVPVSLALTQSAIESGWGKSRFAKEANNIFGHWTYTKNGLIPKNRPKGKTYRLRIFKSLQDSVNAYVKNLNSNYAYRKFREARYKSHKNNRLFAGLVAAKTMINYSEIRGKYLSMIEKVMLGNRFHKFDEITKPHKKDDTLYAFVASK
jgi:Bax protein